MKNFRFFIIVVILLVAAFFNYHLSRPDAELPRKSLTDFPKNLGDWKIVSDQRIDDRALKILQIDDYFIRNYRNSKGHIIGLYVGYWKSQREGKGIHSPRQCLPGAGWEPADTSVYHLPLDHNSDPVSVNRFVMQKGLDRQLYLFWFQGRGRAYASEYWNRLYIILDALVHNRTDGALVRVNNAIIEDPDQSLKIQTDFINLFYPILKEYIPQ